jgi:hypothetical protein
MNSADLVDLEQAYEAYCEIYNAIEELQATDHFVTLPLGLRKSICTARFIADRISNQIEPLI